MTEKVNKIEDTENVYDAQKSDQALEVNVTLHFLCSFRQF